MTKISDGEIKRFIMENVEITIAYDLIPYCDPEISVGLKFKGDEECFTSCTDEINRW